MNRRLAAYSSGEITPSACNYLSMCAICRSGVLEKGPKGEARADIWLILQFRGMDNNIQIKKMTHFGDYARPDSTSSSDKFLSSDEQLLRLYSSWLGDFMKKARIPCSANWDERRFLFLTAFKKGSAHGSEKSYANASHDLEIQVVTDVQIRVMHL